MQKPQFWKDVPADHLETAKAAFSESVPLKRLGTVQEVASAYVHLMTNGFITGQVLAVDGGVMLRKNEITQASCNCRDAGQRSPTSWTNTWQARFTLRRSRALR